ncbi:MAG: hypothetical protein ACK4Q5_07370 [Saprospiraceae bacterium]
MKNKLVLWGTNAQNEKVLVALELQADTNKVQLYTFPEAIASEEFVNKMMQEWRNGSEVEFPEGFAQLERELSVTENLLPEDLKVERPDLVTRAQTEWHFAVLSSKLNQAYQQELAEFKEKVAALTNYEHSMWDGLRSFWDKVQDQVRERNLWREHADDLRDGINALFDDLKKLRARVNDEFVSASQRVYEDMNNALDGIEAKIAAGGNKLNAVFEDLKQLQRKYREAKMTNEHRNKLWDRLDGAFKSAKEKRFGPSANEGTLAERHVRRMQGLNEAIARMEDSVRRDEEELEFQSRKVAASEGQLEAQIRQAKIKMVEERVASKRDKLKEMYHTRTEVERQINVAKEKEGKRAEKDAERQKFEQAKEQVKAEIGAKATKLADNPKQDSLFEAATTVLGEVFENAIDTMKAVGKVAAEKAEDLMDKAEDKFEAVVEQAEEKIEAVVEAIKKGKNEAAEKAEAAAESATEAVAEATEKAETTAEVVAETVAEAVEEAKPSTGEEASGEKTEDAKTEATA